MHKLKPFFFLVMLPAVLLLSGCEKDRKAEKEVAAFMERSEKLAQARKNEAEKKEKPIVSYVYESTNLRDPFDQSEGSVSAKHYSNSILSDISLDDLTLVGTVLKNNDDWAVVRDSNGNLYRLTKGMHVGVQQAMLVGIKQNEITFKPESEFGSKDKLNDIVMKVQE